MTAYVIVKKAPETLPNATYVIDKPNFYEEIKQFEQRIPKTKEMTENFLRDVVNAAGLKYVGPEFDVFRFIKASLYRGIPFDTIDDIHTIVMKCVKNDYPQLIDAYVDYYIRKRPHGTKLIYFLGSFFETAPFDKHGIDNIKEKDIPVVLGLKKKKVVGKPAITDEEARLRNA